MKKILLLTLFSLVGCVFNASTIGAQTVSSFTNADKTSIENKVTAINLKSGDAQTKIKELEKLETETKKTYHDIKTANDTIINAYNDAVKNHTDKIAKLDQEINKSGTAVEKKNKLQGEKKRIQDTLKQYKSQQSPNIKKARDATFIAQQALTKVISAKTQHQRTIEAKENIQRLQSINTISSSLNPDDFLSVGNEKNINLDSNDESNIISRLLKYMIRLLGTFGVIMMIIAGIFMITSEGDENRLQKGKNIFIYTAIGILVAFTSYALIQFILSILFS